MAGRGVVVVINFGSGVVSMIGGAQYDQGHCLGGKTGFMVVVVVAVGTASGGRGG